MELNKSYAYREAYSEVYYILLNMEYNDVKKIPKRLINLIRKNRIKNYIVNINPLIPLQNQELKEETKAILSILYRKYLCDEVTKEKIEKEFIKKIKNEKLILDEQKLTEKVIDEKVKIEERVEKSLLIKRENVFIRILKKMFKIV